MRRGPLLDPGCASDSSHREFGGSRIVMVVVGTIVAVVVLGHDVTSGRLNESVFLSTEMFVFALVTVVNVGVVVVGVTNVSVAVVNAEIVCDARAPVLVLVLVFGLMFVSVRG